LGTLAIRKAGQALIALEYVRRSIKQTLIFLLSAILIEKKKNIVKQFKKLPYMYR